VNPGAFLDRDGTINIDTGYVSHPDQLEFTPGAVEAIRKLNESGYRVAVITNQAGVARGFYTEADVEIFHAEISRQLASAGAHIDRFYYCPHHEDGTIERYAIQCDCRKPGDNLYRKAIEELDLDPARCIAVGDKPNDLIPAIALGARGILVVPPDNLDRPSPEEQRFHRAANLRSAVELLLE
jgi:D-glycero-D-manno-heptose 1,7-bisphosphate phosphatase